MARGLFVAALVAVLAYAPVVTYEFVYDDQWTVQGNRALDGSLAPLVRALVLGRAAAKAVPDATRPSMVVSLWVDRHLFGDDPAGYHLHSLLLYAAASALAFLAVFAVTRRRTAALVGGALFAAAPLHAEVAAAVNYREDLHAAMAVLGCVAWLFWPRTRPPKIDHAVLVAALVLFGALGKESAVSVLPVALAIAVLRFGSARRLLAVGKGSAGVVLAALAGYSAWRGWLALAGRDDVPRVLTHPALGERLWRTARYVVRGALDGLFPLRSSPEYAPEATPGAAWVVALAALVGLAALLARRRSTRGLAAALGVALAAPIAACPLLSPINETQDRYFFTGVLGGALLSGELAALAARRLPGRARRAIFIAALVPLLFLCRRAAAPWSDELSLWRQATLSAPASARAWTGLSRALRMRGSFDEADRAIERAIAADPAFLRARVTRIYNRLARGDVEGARQDIAEVERRGGRRQRGMSQAIRCAALSPEAARPCAAARE